jgi:DNA integrity scanning protein DisA with diadenylate cyclase activity
MILNVCESKKMNSNVSSRYRNDTSLSDILERLCKTKKGIYLDVIKSVISLSIEISREGREGRKIGTMFIIGDEEYVLASSRPLILDPLYGHPPEKKNIHDLNLRETIKELAQLDGAFIVSGDGVVIAASRYIYAQSKHIQIPLGLGSRHIAAASVTYNSNAVAVVVSESSIVRIVADGKILTDIIPELWLIERTKLNNDDQMDKAVTDIEDDLASDLDL